MKSFVIGYYNWMTEERRNKFMSFGLLLVRIGFGSTMLINHGWGKLINFTERSATFPDPLGIGNATSMGLAVFSEFFCSLAIVLGLATRLATVPLIFTVLVIVFVVHADDPLQKKELILLYLWPYLLLFFSGSGQYSLDALYQKKFKG